MATKADLLLKTYTLRYEIATVKGEAENLLTPEQYQNTYRFYEQLKKSKLYDLQQDVEMLTKALETAKAKKAAAESRETFYATAEGQAFKAEKEAAIAAETKNYEKTCMAKLTALEILIKANLGNHWQVQNLSTSCCAFGIKKDGKSVFGQTVEIYYERRNWLDDNKERFEISVGSTGSFDLCKNEVGDRARFYMDFGKFLSNTALLGDLKNMLFDYADTMEEIHERMERLQKSLENPLA